MKRIISIVGILIFLIIIGRFDNSSPPPTCRDLFAASSDLRRPIDPADKPRDVGFFRDIPHTPLLNKVSFSQQIYDEHQQLLRLTLTSDEKYRIYVPLKDISPLLINSTLLQEDRYFYWHFGVNPLALWKAGWQTYIAHSRKMGASTLTMQLARLYYGIDSKKFSGKILQIARALQLELFYSKDQILETYLNLAPYGGNIEGVGAASLIYFGKTVNQLNLPEALLLSVIPQNPQRRNPMTDKNKIKLQSARLRLFSAGIDRAQLKFLLLPLQFSDHQLPFLAPHFVDAILKTLPQSPVVITTLNLKLQQILEKVARDYLASYQQYGIHNLAALLVDTRDMQVKALVGSANFLATNIKGQVNGTNAKRSPGSSLKPFIYALALDQGIIHPYTVLKDAPSQFGAYDPENFDNQFMGPIKAKDALTLSRNIPAVYLMNHLSKPSFYQFLQTAHIGQLKTESHYGLSLALGGSEVTMQELVELYAMLANQGLWRPLRTQVNQPLLPGERLLSPEAAFLTLDMLKDTPRPNPLNSAMMPQLPVYWKTGTSSAFRDAWSVGIFGPYVLAVWVGDFDGKSNPAYVGVKAAAPLFFTMIARIKAQSPVLASIMPDPHRLKLTRVSVCDASGLLPNRYCPNLKETWFIPGKSPIKTDNVYREVAINRKTGLRTCHFDANTRWEVYEFWSSDLLKIFAEAGIQRRTPPVFESDCTLEQFPTSAPPKIISPHPNLIYTIRLANPASNKILFTASSDADVKKLYWFINNNFLGIAQQNQTLSWQAKPGKYVVRVIDDHGRVDVMDLAVENIN